MRASNPSLQLLLCSIASVLAAAPPTSTFCASNKDICGGLNIPTSGDDTFFQIKATTTGGWAGMGIGSQMMGALIFIIYPDKAGTNVTVSPRLGKGHFEPVADPDIDIQLLSGSGVDTGSKTMTANFKCSNCRKWDSGSLSTTSTTTGFIWAIGPGTIVESDDKDLDTLTQHRVMGTASIDSKAATGGDGSVNPFDSSSSPSSSGSGSGSSSASATKSGTSGGGSSTGGGTTATTTTSGSSSSSTGASASGSGSAASSTPSSGAGLGPHVAGVILGIGVGGGMALAAW